jgi:sugar O-acyltransferase (sialic acid O-acetyltransferase NeuD family)
LSGAPLQQIVVYGTRGFGREVHQLIKDLAAVGAPVACAGFLIDAAFRESSVVHELPVYGDDTWLAQAPDVKVAIAIGATAPRWRIAQRIEREFGSRFPTLRHPRAWVGDNVSFGIGSIACAGALVTTDIAVGKHVQLHVGCTIGHDTVIHDFVTVAPGANVSGRVVIGEGTFVGVGAVILPDIRVGRWTTIGAGAVVTKHVPDNVTIVGVPGRVISQRAPGWQSVDS